MFINQNRSRVPEDLSSVTQRAVECDAEAVGMTEKGRRHIWRAVEDYYRTGLQPGMSLCIRRRGQVVLNRAIGHARGNGPGERATSQTPMTPDTPVCLFSASKAISAMLLHKLVEDGRVALTDRVMDYLPEYGVNGKEETTLRHLMAHRAGIPRVPVKNPDPKLLMDWDGAIKMLCAAKPVAGPGEQQAYHAVTGGFIIGEIARRVTGRPLTELLRDWIAAPLGAQHLTYGLPVEARGQEALNYFTGPKLVFPVSVVAKRALGIEFEKVATIANDESFLSSVIPAGNIYATADEASRFFQMLMNGGLWNGQRLFREDTIATAIKPVGGIGFDRTLMVPVRFTPGFIRGEKPFGLYGENCPQAYGHLGFINIVCWADPARDISVALLNTGKSMSPDSLPGLGKILWAISHYCPPQKG